LATKDLSLDFNTKESANMVIRLSDAIEF